MRENRLEVVLLDPEFDPAEQGAAFVTREVNILRPPQRRGFFRANLTSFARLTRMLPFSTMPTLR